MVTNDLNFYEALVHLSNTDKILGKVIKEIKPEEPEKREPNFESLVRIITGQQLSSTAASKIFNRLKELLGKKEITPLLIKAFKPQQILKCGLSNAKTKYIQNLANLFLKKPSFLDELKDKEEKLRNELVELEQMFGAKKEQYLKILGAIEALEALDPSVPPVITPHPKE